MPAADLSLAEARALALTAQGFAVPRPSAPPDRAALVALVERLGVIQLDSVNVLVRSHYLPAWSRLGAYDRAALDALAFEPPRAVFEFWGHEASWLPVALHPLLRWRMARAVEDAWRHVRAMKGRRAFLAKVLAAVEARGPVGAGELAIGKPGKAGWWEWSEDKRAIEWLFWSGQVTTSARRGGFERLYDLPARVLPADVLAAPTPAEAEAHAALVDRAGRAMGVATEADLRDYFRLGAKYAKPAIAALVERGRLARVTVQGWSGPAYLHAEARAAAIAPDRAALLSPFDNLIWARDRTERLFGMRYRLEIYTPAAKRVHGYYVLPFLLGDRLVARVDLKSDREAGALRVHAAHGERKIDKRAVAEALAGELAAMAAWLGLARVEVAADGGGDLDRSLRVVLRSRWGQKASR